MIDTELAKLAEQVTRDPRDRLTVQAIADRLEELGAEPEEVRSLAVGDGDMIVITWGSRNFLPSDEWNRVRNTIVEWFAKFDKRVEVMAIEPGTKLSVVTRRRD